MPRQDDGSEDPEWRLSGVYLLTDETETNLPAGNPHGEVAVQGLTLSFVETGVVLEGPDGDTVWACDWPDMAEISATGSAVLPDGGAALQVLAVERNGATWRLVVPSEDTDGTWASLRHRAKAHGLRSAARPPSARRTVTVAVALLAAATLTLLLLSAAHVISI